MDSHPVIDGSSYVEKASSDHNHLAKEYDRLEIVVVPFKAGNRFVSSTGHSAERPCGSYEPKSRSAGTLRQQRAENHQP